MIDPVFIEEESMVDVGCGSGQSTSQYSSYFGNVTGIDVSKEQLDSARNSNQFDNVEFK